ncbi:hypothetical protein [Halpernia sp. GG3]
MDKINKDFTIISAEKSTWFGGREGVKGTSFYFILKNNQNQTFKFTSLKIGKNSYPLKTDIKKDSIFISASVSSVYHEPQLNMDTGKTVENKIKTDGISAVSLEYILLNSKIIHIIPVKNISERDSDIFREALPN